MKAIDVLMTKVDGSEFTNNHGEPCHVLVDDRGEFFWLCPADDTHDDELNGPFDTVEEAQEHGRSFWR